MGGLPLLRQDEHCHQHDRHTPAGFRTRNLLIANHYTTAAVHGVLTENADSISGSADKADIISGFCNCINNWLMSGIPSAPVAPPEV